jgi:hypothetical protein
MFSGKQLKSSPTEIVDIIRREKGCTFKVDWHGAWDPNESEGKAELRWVNDGRGFLPAVQVDNTQGTMFYVGPFEIEQMPTNHRLFMFHCTSAFFVRSTDLGAPDAVAGFVAGSFGR